MKTAIITGATSGIGFAITKALLEQQWRVIGIGHRNERCAQAEAAIHALLPNADVTFLCHDLTNQSYVHAAADEVTAQLTQKGIAGIDALILNAGCVRSYYTTSAEGYEQQLALNFLSGVLLTHRLLPQLSAASGRVLWTGSGSHKNMRVHWDDLMLQKQYNPLAAYKQSKLCAMLFTQGFNQRMSATGVRMYVIDPGLVNTEIGNKETSGLVRFVWSLRKRHGVSPEVPAQTFAYVCSHMPAPEGLYYYNCASAPHSPYADDARYIDRMFLISEQLCGVRFQKEEAA